LEKSRQASTGKGQLVIEVHTMAAVKAIGEQEFWWDIKENGLFSEQPHLLLKEAFWDARLRVTTERYYIVDAQSGEVTRHAASTQGYQDDAYERLLESCGFSRIRKHLSLGGKKGVKDKNYVVFTAKAAYAP
jgi:hypothetical protein